RISGFADVGEYHSESWTSFKHHSIYCRRHCRRESRLYRIVGCRKNKCVQCAIISKESSKNARGRLYKFITKYFHWSVSGLFFPIAGQRPKLYLVFPRGQSQQCWRENCYRIL